MQIHIDEGHDVELVNVLIVGRLLTHRVIVDDDMANDADKAIGREPVEHERTSHRAASKASQKSTYKATLNNEMSSNEDGSSAYSYLNRTACSTIGLL